MFRSVRSLAVARDEAARAGLERQAAAAHDTLLATARRSSRLVILMERRRDRETAPAVQTARLVAREGRVTLQALAGPLLEFCRSVPLRALP